MNKNQYIGLQKKEYAGFACSTISNPMALDTFAVNVIDVSDANIWNCSKYDSFVPEHVEQRENLLSLKDIVLNSKKSIQVVIVPQNIRITRKKVGYLFYDDLKNNISFINDCLKNYMFALPNFSLGFESNETIINGRKIHSDFYFKNCTDIVTTAIESDKPTTIKVRENLFFTSLFLKEETDIIDFLKSVGLYKETNEYPLWLDEFNFNDDKCIKEKNRNLQTQIDSINNEIDLNNNKLKENLLIKSILIETGDNLVSIVFKIINEMLNIDLFDFEDEKKEDFLFKIDGFTFIGEIKGINEGIRNTFISQIDNHKSLYEDKLQDENLPSETIKKILIINDQRKKPIKDRDPIHQNQIEKAKKEDVLIIRGIDLLNIYELFKQNKIKREEIFEILKTQKGPIYIEPFKNS